MWVRLITSPIPKASIRFQFTHPCGCDAEAFHSGCPLPCFNSRTRVGATEELRSRSPESKVSIHAPVWVRRCMVLPFLHDFKVSIHAPVWVRHWHTLSRGEWPCFNSRTRVGATNPGCRMTNCYLVSIHAPVWVRHIWSPSSFMRSEFQFTHPCGCDGLTNTV